MKNIKESAVILPYVEGKILMQLRDDRNDIVFPGRWGFFSGTMEPGEEPIDCARRELFEETCIRADELFYLSVDRIEVPDELVLHSFYCYLDKGLKEMKLCEGYDFGLFGYDEIFSKQLFSPRAGKAFSVIEHPITNHLLNALLAAVGTSGPASGNSSVL
jgi:8-oxo-dGTP diphosphatase